MQVSLEKRQDIALTFNKWQEQGFCRFRRKFNLIKDFVSP